jgi:phage repressor protein C with HTH and peptisase S24 domain
MTQIAIEMAGQSMAPTIQPGARLLAELITGADQIGPGDICIVVDRNGQETVRRLFPVEGGVKLVSDHPDQQLYPSYVRMWSQLQGIFKVKASGYRH